jgi:hypothetical protein
MKITEYRRNRFIIDNPSVTLQINEYFGLVKKELEDMIIWNSGDIDIHLYTLKSKLVSKIAIFPVIEMVSFTYDTCKNEYTTMWLSDAIPKLACINSQFECEDSKLNVKYLNVDIYVKCEFVSGC